MTRSSIESVDPLTLACAPPADETPEEREARLHQEAEAKRVSDAIDDELKAERAELRKKKRIVKVLLLGQAESGKSTTLKNFQMMYAAPTWKAERSAWRAVIQLNLVRHVNIILDTLAVHLSKRSPHPSTLGLSSNYLSSPVSPSDNALPPRRGTLPISTTPSESTEDSELQFKDSHRALRLRLAPLRRLEADLRGLLGMPVEENNEDSSPLTPLTPSQVLPAPAKNKEIAVRSWKGALTGTGPRRPARGKMSVQARDEEADGVTDVLVMCREDIKSLWEDPIIKRMLAKEGIKLEQQPGFYLDSIDRVTDPAYEPTDHDIIHARLRTTGIQEYHLSPDPITGFPKEDWIIYDVGGSRTQRRAWLPYFENVTAIIFLAPISCLDEQLEEDRRVNRLEDSFLLWSAVVASKLIARTTIVLFTNKVDLLEGKIKNGLRVKEWLTSYVDRPNTAADVTKYLLSKFKDAHTRLSPERRNFYGYPTSVVDTEATQRTLASIRDSILMGALKDADMIE